MKITLSSSESYCKNRDKILSVEYGMYEKVIEINYNQE